jgi:glycosyltransferase involved in cell wall biosynthesis
MAEEYVDAGRWERGSAPWRLTKWVERRALQRARECVVLTPAARELLFRPGDDRATVIPCCADLTRFLDGRRDRDEMRKRLDIGNRPVLAYVGKFGGWYMQREMVEFFALARELRGDLHFLVLTQDEPSAIELEFTRHGLPEESYTVTRVPPERMGAALAAADLAISFVAPMPSKVASCPTKLGEYLAAGLPVVSTEAAGGFESILVDTQTGVVIGDFSPKGMRVAAEEALSLLNDAGAPDRCRRLAAEGLSLADVGIPSYDAMYQRLAA